MGYPVVDADQLAREVVRSGSPGLKAVVHDFVLKAASDPNVTPRNPDFLALGKAVSRARSA